MTKSLAPGKLVSRFLSRAMGLGIAALGTSAALLASLATRAGASELDLQIPAINTSYTMFGTTVQGATLMYAGFAICVVGALFGLVQFNAVKRLPVHKS